MKTMPGISVGVLRYLAVPPLLSDLGLLILEGYKTIF